jgi:hypothetical protein
MTHCAKLRIEITSFLHPVLLSQSHDYRTEVLSAETSGCKLEYSDKHTHILKPFEAEARLNFI